MHTCRPRPGVSLVLVEELEVLESLTLPEEVPRTGRAGHRRSLLLSFLPFYRLEAETAKEAWSFPADPDLRATALWAFGWVTQQLHLH